MGSLVRTQISLASDFGLPVNFEDWCGRFDQYSVAVLVVAVLVAKSFVAVLGVAVLECGRFDQDPLKLSQKSVFLPIAARVWGLRLHPQTLKTAGFSVKDAIILQWIYLCIPDGSYTKSMFIIFIQISHYNKSPCRLFYINLKETWLHGRDLDDPSACSEPGDK